MTTTEHFDRSRSEVKDDQSERAQRAVKAFRAMQHGLSSYAKAITGNKSLVVEMASGTPRTDGKKIYYQPPIALGDGTEHSRRDCDKRDETSRLICPACAIREEVLVSIYHEIGHIAGDSFVKTSDAAKSKAIKSAIDEWGGKYAEQIKARFQNSPSRVTDSYMGLAKLVSPYLPFLVNCIEDARVDTAMFKARKGVRTMMQASTVQIFSEGFTQADGSIKLWRDAPLNSQASIACYLMPCGYVGWQDYLSDEVATAFEDDLLAELLSRVPDMKSAHETYEVAFPVLARLRELGFFQLPEDKEEEQDDSEDQEESDEAGDPSDGVGSGEAEESNPEESSNEPSGDEAGTGEDEGSDDGPGGDEGEQDSSGAPSSSEGEDEVDGSDAGTEDDGSDSESDPEADEADGDSSGGSGDSEDDGDDEQASSEPEAGASGDGQSGLPDSDGEESDGEGDQEPSQDSDGSDSSDESDEGDLDDSESGEGDEAGSEGDGPEDQERLDTGADDGLGGLETDAPDYGTPEDVEGVIEHFHRDDVEVADSPDDDQAVQIAIIQGLYFEKPSQNVGGVREHRFDKPLTNDHGKRIDHGWNHQRLIAGWGSDRAYLGIDVDLEVPETIMGPALLKTRRVFTDNATAKHQHNLKSGRINRKVLGTRAWNDDNRLFSKKRLPGKRSYAVVIGIDISGSTIGENIALAKRAAWAQAELCSRAGVDFAVYAHTANTASGAYGRGEDLWLDVYEIKAFSEPWDSKRQHRLAEIGSDSENLDGHAVEYYRKRLDEVEATDKILLYYTDGKMPAANYAEELEILQREIATCKRKGYTLLGVGIRTDSPVRHGLDTVQVDDDSDLKAVVMHLEKRLVK